MHIPEAVKTYGLIALVIIASFWFASRFIEPPPPKHITMAAGSANGDYYRYAQMYQKELAMQGIKVKVLETAGSVENINLLLSGKADVAFIQSGLAQKGDDKIESLASLYYEPLWIFTRRANIPDKDLKNLRGMKLAIGEKGSGTNAIARQLLKLNDIADDKLFIPLSGNDAVEALKSGRVDAAFFVGGPQSEDIQTLLHNPDMHLLPFHRAESYTRILPFLSKVRIDEGVVDMAADLPPHDIELLSPVAQLTSRADFNGALKTLLVGAAMTIHGDASLLSAKGRFPTLDYADFPVAEEAVRYFKYGPNILQRFLPFWLADTISRMVVMLIPLLGVMLPLLKIASPAYRWRTRSKIYKWYKSLKKMEDTVGAEKSDRKDILDSLERIDAEVKKTKVPLSYADELYNLRLHIQMIKDHIED